MTLTLTLRTEPPARVLAAPLIPERLRGLGAWAVSALELRCGGETVAVGDLFEVSGAGDEQLAFAGDLRRVDWIGSGMSGGRVLVEGPCGDHLGARPGAHIAPHDNLAARHAGANPIEPAQIADQSEALLLVARAGHLEQVAHGHRLTTTAEPDPGDR